jgi:hypothetical protein
MKVEMIQKIEQSINTNLLEKLQFNVFGDSFSFYIPSSLRELILPAEKAEEVAWISKSYETILLFDATIREDCDTCMYHLIPRIKIVYCKDGKIKEKVLTEDTYHEFEKAAADFLRVLAYFHSIGKIFSYLYDNGYGDLILKRIYFLKKYLKP